MQGDDWAKARDGWERGVIPRFNLALLGGTGVGKSTLINAVFGQDVAMTGIGAPVTTGIRFHENDDRPLGLYDFEGVESFAALENFVKNFEKIYHERLAEDPDSAIHGVWYCLKASDRRFDDQQAKVIRRLAAMDLPVIVVLTQTPWRPDIGVAPDARQLIDHITALDLPIVTGGPIPVSALDDEFAGTRKYGLEHLVSVTSEAAAEGVKSAFAAAQRVDARIKRGAAQKVVAAAIAIAGGIAATPIPVADAPLLITTQFEMLRRLSTIYGVTLSATTLATAMTGAGASMIGKTIAGTLLKFVPIAGSVVNAGIAGSITWVLGWTWMELCERDWKGEIDLARVAEEGGLADLLSETLRHWSTRQNQNT